MTSKAIEFGNNSKLRKEINNNQFGYSFSYSDQSNITQIQSNSFVQEFENPNSKATYYELSVSTGETNRNRYTFFDSLKSMTRRGRTKVYSKQHREK